MKIDFNCYKCIFDLIIETSENLSSDRDKAKVLANEMLEHFLKLASSEGTPPELLAHIWGELIPRETGNPDPMREIKQRSTAMALELLPRLRQIAAASPKPFHTAVLLAIAGNIIDYGIDRKFDLSTAESAIMSAIAAPYDAENMELLHRQMEKAGSILYMLDNCGEAVIDRLVMEPFREKITVGVRGKPVLNDVTRQDAAESGIDFAPVIDTGDSTAGISFKRSPAEFLEKLHSFDLVIAKGQGNFESMESIFKRPVFYLFRAKCAVMTGLLGCDLNAIRIIPRNLQD